MSLLNILLVVDPNVVKAKRGHEILLDVVRAYAAFAVIGDVSDALNKVFMELMWKMMLHDNEWLDEQFGLPDSQLCGLLRAVNVELQLLRRNYTEIRI